MPLDQRAEVGAERDSNARLWWDDWLMRPAGLPSPSTPREPTAGFEPATLALGGPTCSAYVDLSWALGIRTLTARFWRPADTTYAVPSERPSQESNPHPVGRNHVPCPLGQRGDVRRGIRTLTERALRPLPLPIGPDAREWLRQESNLSGSLMRAATVTYTEPKWGDLRESNPDRRGHNPETCR